MSNKTETHGSVLTALRLAVHIERICPLTYFVILGVSKGAFLHCGRSECAHLLHNPPRGNMAIVSRNTYRGFPERSIGANLGQSVD